MRRRTVIAGIVTAFAGCSSGAEREPANTTGQPPTTQTRDETATPENSTSPLPTLDAVTVDPSASYDIVTLSPGDDISTTIESGSSQTQYRLNPGEYTVDSVHVPSETIVTGTGPGETILRQQANSSDTHFFDTDGNSYVEISGMTLDVNATAQPQRHKEGTRAIQFAKGEVGIARDLNIRNAGGHSLKWFGWDGGIAHRVLSHSPAETAPRPGGRGAIQAGAYKQTTRNIILHNCETRLPNANISHRGTDTKGILITNCRVVDPDMNEDWRGIDLHRTTGGLVAGNLLRRGSSKAKSILCYTDTSDVTFIGNRVAGGSIDSLEEAIYVGDSTRNIQFKRNTVGAGEAPPLIIDRIGQQAAEISCEGQLSYSLEESDNMITVNSTCSRQ